MAGMSIAARLLCGWPVADKRRRDSCDVEQQQRVDVFGWVDRGMDCGYKVDDAR